VAPLYYGMLAFADAAPPGSRILQIGHEPPVPTLRIWATRAADGTERVVLINESPDRGQTLTLPAGPARTATLSRLTAPALSATHGVAIGGQAFADASTTGSLVGAPDTPTLSRVQGRFVVPLPAASAAIVTIPPG
jgi:hypothetical protein